MTYSEAKQSLKELKSLKRLIKVKLAQIEEERKQISITAVDYSKERISGGESVPLQQRFIEHIERLERDYEQLLDRMRETEDMLAEHLTELSPIEQAIIIERYMYGKSWRQIEREYDYSIDNVYKIHGSALRKISQSLQ